MSSLTIGIAIFLYLLVAVGGLVWLARRADRLSCSLGAGLRRSVLFALVVTPSVIPGFDPIPAPASLLGFLLAAALLTQPSYGVFAFGLGFGLFVLVPVSAVTALTFAWWALVRWRRSRRPALLPRSPKTDA